jgi:hypothetical protein
MTNPTSNFGWQMPTPTDLVTDLPADFEVFGQAVDTSMADLKGGTTGQILSKATNADMDFTWITNDVGDITAVTVSSPLTGGGTSGSVSVGILSGTTSNLGAVQLSDSTSSTSTTLAATANAVKTSYDLAAAAVPKSTVTTAGDIIYATGSSAVTRLGIGSTGQVLKVAGGVPSWASDNSKVLQVIYGSTTTSTTNATTTYADTTLTATITPTLATSKVLVMIAQNGLEKGGANANNSMGIKIFRGATEISASTPVMLYTGVASEVIGTSYAQNVLDQPATTSATTYKTQFRNANNGSGIVVQYDNALSTIVLMEIGA